MAQSEDEGTEIFKEQFEKAEDVSFGLNCTKASKLEQ